MFLIFLTTILRSKEFSDPMYKTFEHLWEKKDVG